MLFGSHFYSKQLTEHLRYTFDQCVDVCSLRICNATASYVTGISLLSGDVRNTVYSYHSFCLKGNVVVQ